MQQCCEGPPEPETEDGAHAQESLLKERVFTISLEGPAKVSLPANMWGALVGIIISWSEPTSGEFFFVVVPVMLGMAATCAMQVSFIFHLKGLAEEGFATEAAHQCTSLDTSSGQALLLQCVFVYVSSVLHVDMDETMNMFTYQYRLRTYSAGTGVMEPPGLHYTEDGRVRSKISSPTRIMIGIILLTKNALALALVHWGVGFVAKSKTREEVLLNAMAMLFILDVDELLYNIFLPGPVKRILQDTPPVAVGYKGLSMQLYWVWQGFGRIALAVVIVGMEHHRWCHSNREGIALPDVGIALLAIGAAFALVVFCGGWLQVNCDLKAHQEQEAARHAELYRVHEVEYP